MERTSDLAEKLMYGNVDAASKFFKLPSQWITGTMKMKQSFTDPCVFYKLNNQNKLMLLVSVAVDDCTVTGLELDIKVRPRCARIQYVISNKIVDNIF